MDEPIRSSFLRARNPNCGDLLSQPVSNGGLGVGTVGTSVIFLTTIVGLVLYLTARKRCPAVQ